MATINDYKSGNVVRNVKLTVFLKFVEFPIIGPFVGGKLLEKTKSFEPRIINMDQATDIILKSDKCAVGERVCRVLNENSEFTESVFLNSLAEGMIDAGKAQPVEKEAAISTLKKYPKNPLILSKVSGKYSEICRSAPQYLCLLQIRTIPYEMFKSIYTLNFNKDLEFP
jgi:hypothetical protein